MPGDAYGAHVELKNSSWLASGQTDCLLGWYSGIGAPLSNYDSRQQMGTKNKTTTKMKN